MATKSVITKIRRKKMAEASHTTGKIAKITHIALGSGGVDANRKVIKPLPENVRLKHEVIRKPYTSSTKVSETSYEYVIKLEENELIGVEISEMALIDEDGDVAAFSNFLAKGKGSAAHYVLNGLEETLKLEKQLKTGTYKARQTTKFRVTYPKPRDIVSICFRDRVYQRSLNDNAIYPAMTKSFIQHNCACQKDKGTDYARAVLDEFLHRHYRKYGRAGGVLQVDVHGYYPNMKHQVAKDKFKKHLEPDIYKRAEAVLEDQYEGDVGYNPGSQMIQIAGISVLDELDHFIKEQLGIKRYLRYMDDFLLMHEDLEYLEYCKDKVIEKLAEYGFEPNPKKTKVIPITEEILFLGFYYRLTETGKIIMRLNPANVKQERKKLYRLVAKAKKGESSKAKVDECFNGWKDHAAKGTSYQLLRRMEAYYKELWRNQDGISTDQNKRL